MFILQFCQIRKDASILTSGIAALYALYLQWTALSSDPAPECNKFIGNTGMAILQIVLGMFVTMFALFMMSGTQATGDVPEKEPVKTAEEQKEDAED